MSASSTAVVAQSWRLATIMTLCLTAALAVSGCGGTPPKPPAGSEESPLDLKVEVDGDAAAENKSP
ncbi:MAG: hypothetical protein ACKO38_11505 [Planctomycetota bacterium]